MQIIQGFNPKSDILHDLYFPLMMWHVLLRSGMKVISTGGGGGAHWLEGSFVAVAGEWTHLAVVYDAGQVTTYVNGEQDGQLAGTLGTGTGAQVTLGFANDGVGNPGEELNGLIDEVLIYNRPLSVAEIQELMNGDPVSNLLAVEPAGKLTTTWGSLKR